MRLHTTFAITALAALTAAQTAAPRKQPVELGLVPWNRDFAAAERLVKKTGKPMLLLFQEVPG